MAKTLSARISERVRSQVPNQKAKNRAAFLAHRDDIRQALDDGWAVKVIWATLKDEGKITFSYQAFTGYVNRLIAPKEPKPPRHDTTAARTRSISKDFTFNSTPNKEELL